ncbi:MAG: GNAT family N-acetyltransferase [Clostridia bacterium]|nr:GNAT family N-acetyltransferase [Clostridia bacterium]
MKRYNIILLVDERGENTLMCRRRKPPYEGLLNLVGGKAETGEDGLHAAYRELREETGVTAADVTLSLVATFDYPQGGAGLPAYELQAYAGRLRRELPVYGEENPLCWTPMTENFFDMTRYAGEGSIGHVMETVRRYKPELLRKREPVITLVPLCEDDLAVAAYYRGVPPEGLKPMLDESLAQTHDGRYYEQFSICLDGCMCGMASLYQQDEETVSDGVEVFAPFRSCGIAGKALALLAETARRKGYARMSAQVRTDNAASRALHRYAGFAVRRTLINRRGNEVYIMEKVLTVRHEMSLRPKPFEAIASGRKTYELRLHDGKRRAIRVGDEILFTCTADGRTVLTRVAGLHPFSDFASLYASLPLLQCGYTPENVGRADPKDMEAYYPPEKQVQYGVLAIEISRVRLPVEALYGEFDARELQAADVPEMLRLAQGNPMYYEYMHVQPATDNLLETLTALPPKRTMADKHFFGWFEGGRLAAMMDLILHHPAEDAAFIGWFMVEAERQGCGLGRRLVAEVLAMLREHGVTEVRLGRIDGNQQSERFWQACGFHDNGLGYDTEDYHVSVMARKLDT